MAFVGADARAAKLMQTWIHEEFIYISHKRDVGNSDVMEERRIRQELQIHEFNGRNIDEWLVQMESFFHFFQLNEEEKLKVAEISFDGDALRWFEWEYPRKPFEEWRQLKNQLMRRFGGGCDGLLSVRVSGEGYREGSMVHCSGGLPRVSGSYGGENFFQKMGNMNPNLCPKGRNMQPSHEGIAGVKEANGKSGRFDSSTSGGGSFPNNVAIRGEGFLQGHAGASGSGGGPDIWEGSGGFGGANSGSFGAGGREIFMGSVNRALIRNIDGGDDDGGGQWPFEEFQGSPSKREYGRSCQKLVLEKMMKILKDQSKGNHVIGIKDKLSKGFISPWSREFTHSQSMAVPLVNSGRFRPAFGPIQARPTHSLKEIVSSCSSPFMGNEIRPKSNLPPSKSRSPNQNYNPHFSTLNLPTRPSPLVNQTQPHTTNQICVPDFSSPMVTEATQLSHPNSIYYPPNFRLSTRELTKPPPSKPHLVTFSSKTMSHYLQLRPTPLIQFLQSKFDPFTTSCNNQDQLYLVSSLEELSIVNEELERRWKPGIKDIDVTHYQGRSVSANYHPP